MSVIVGAGVVTPLGGDLRRTWEALLAGRCAVDTISRFDASGFPVQIAAEGPGSIEGAVELGRMWLDAALEEALAGVDLSTVPAARRGVFLGAEAARPPVEQLVAALDGVHAGPEVVDAHAPWASLRRVAARVGAAGPATVISTIPRPDQIA